MLLLREQKEGEEPKKRDRVYRRRRKTKTVHSQTNSGESQNHHNDKWISKRRSTGGKPHHSAIET